MGPNQVSRNTDEGQGPLNTSKKRIQRQEDSAGILHEAFYYERGKHGIFGLILEVRTRMYFSTIRPQTSRINFALRARTFPHFHRSRYEVSCNMPAVVAAFFPLRASKGTGT
jgi:hypothetical protein